MHGALYLVDVEGNRYIDYVNSWGPLVLGHAAPEVVQALTQQCTSGTSYGACCEQEVRLAKEIKKYFPSIEMLRFVNSGTEAGMAVLRLARGYTGKNKIIKFNGCYHGHADSLLVKAGSGAATFGVPSSQGVAPEVANLTYTTEFNDIEGVEKILERYHDEIAAIIIEPIVGNSGFIKPQNDFLSALRSLCDQYSILLIFDEVMTGFRVALGGAQSVYDVKPDLTMLGKVIGGGLPVGAFGGRKDIMELLAPLGSVYQAGTLSGNPLAMVAGLATIQSWSEKGVFDSVSNYTKKFMMSFNEIAQKYQIPFCFDYLGSMFGFFFSSKPVTNFIEASSVDTDLFAKFFQTCLKKEYTLLHRHLKQDLFREHTVTQSLQLH